MQPVFEAKASPLVASHFACLSNTYRSLVGVSKLVVQVMETMMEHPELLGESLVFFPRLYHT